MFSRIGGLDVASFYQAVTDNPCVYLALQIIAAYPEAQVILQTRDLDSWYTSFRATAFAFLHDSVINHLCVLDKSMAQWWPVSYKLHYAAFRGSHEHEKENLLGWKVQDGWGPLCEVLGERRPEGMFPQFNEGADFALLVKDIRQDLLMKAAKRVGLCAIGGR